MHQEGTPSKAQCLQALEGAGGCCSPGRQDRNAAPQSPGQSLLLGRKAANTDLWRGRRPARQNMACQNILLGPRTWGKGPGMHGREEERAPRGSPAALASHKPRQRAAALPSSQGGRDRAQAPFPRAAPPAEARQAACRRPSWAELPRPPRGSRPAGARRRPPPGRLQRPRQGPPSPAPPRRGRPRGACACVAGPGLAPRTGAGAGAGTYRSGGPGAGRRQ